MSEHKISLTVEERVELAKHVLEDGMSEAADIWGPNGESACAAADNVSLWRRGLAAVRVAFDAERRARQILGPDLLELVEFTAPEDGRIHDAE